MNNQRKEKGFTIIEVVLVLAIAGLIFLMVFLALPALQRSQRDTQRKNDLSRVQTALSSYQSNNKGALPTNTPAGWNAFVAKYVVTGASDTFIDPLGTNANQAQATQLTYEAQVIGAATGLTGSFTSTGATATQNVVYFSSGFTCGTDGALTSAGSKKVAMSLYLEGGGVACVNN
jgi:prepilin-type N-terminal cleavage/methylation domain-containing protein